MAKKQKAARVVLSGLNAAGIVARLGGKYGEGTLAVASDIEDCTQEYTSTGVYLLDIGLGGGFPDNRMTELRGPFSSLKSTIAIVGGANFQKRRKKSIVCIIDVEKTFSPQYAKLLGLDLSRTVIVNPDSGEQGVDVLTDLLESDANIYMIIDSIAAMVPNAELEGSVEDQYMGLHPRLIGRMMRVATSRMKRSFYTKDVPIVTIVALNQLREKIGVMFGNPETTPGGRAKDFYYSVMVRLSAPPSGKITEEITRNGVTRTIHIGNKVNFSINKNKAGGSQHEEGEFEYYKKEYKHYLPFSFNNDCALYDYGIFFDIIKVQGKKLICHGVKLPLKKGLAVKKLNSRPKLMSRIYEEIMHEIAEENAPDLNKLLDEIEDDEEETLKKKKKTFTVLVKK